MKIRTVLTAAVLVAVTMPAFAQSSFFIVQDSRSKRCSIVDQRPTGTEMTIVGPNGVTYKSRTEAEDAMKTVTVCHP